MELIVGCRNKTELQELDNLLNLFQVVKLTSHISDIAVILLRQYRLSHGLLIPDALIAATTLAQGVAFTKNQRLSLHRKSKSPPVSVVLICLIL